MFNLSIFPPPESANEDGLVAVGGDYSPLVLLEAYSKGIFPWFEENGLIFWYSPDPRFVIFKEDFRIGKRLLRYYKKHPYRITFNNNFLAVMRYCQLIKRKDQSTWITDRMIEGYTHLHKLGYAISVEVWRDKKLVGGLYGVNIGKYFCGESMFSLEPNTSKFAFIELAKKLFYDLNYPMIDCQVYSEHMERFGGKEIPRKEFLKIVKEMVKKVSFPQNSFISNSHC